MTGKLRAAEFFAGIGLMRAGLEQAGIETVWANDIEPAKRDMYVANFGDDEFVLADVREIGGDDVPDVELATASFPCTDLSLAGNRRGLGESAAPAGQEGGSSMFWEFARVLDEMAERRPSVILLENVLGFASSRDGQDLHRAIVELNRLGYSCDPMTIDARHFVPQSRPRLFIVGVMQPRTAGALRIGKTDPRWLHRLVEKTPSVTLHRLLLPSLPSGPRDLREVVDALNPAASEWWSSDRLTRFLNSLSPINQARLNELQHATEVAWRTAYRRTRNGRAVWEIRSDAIAGCLRTARGGSSKQALVEAGCGAVRVRWMSPREYARLMGAPSFSLSGRGSQALFGFGDAVCVPVVRWLCENYVARETRRKPSGGLVAVA